MLELSFPGQAGRWGLRRGSYRWEGRPHQHRIGLGFEGTGACYPAAGQGGPPRHREGTRLIKYLGSKRLLVPLILERVEALGGARTVLDLFSGTARVAHALKERGYVVHANDHNAYAAALGTCYVGAERRRWQARAERLIAELDALPGRPGWFTDTFCKRARYLMPINGARVDAIRTRIARFWLVPEMEAIALGRLMEVADRVELHNVVLMTVL